MDEEKPHWSYQGDTGPKHWGDLREEYRICKEGNRQSPIELGGATERTYSKSLNVPDETIQGTMETLRTGIKFFADEPGVTLEWGDENFSLKEFHFHVPSEHTLDGNHYPMESHFVHTDSNGNLLVMGLFLEKGGANETWKRVQNSMYERDVVSLQITMDNLLPPPGSFLFYDGSLTTPPCHEEVKWVILDSIVGVEQRWIEDFRERYGPNNRPLQPLNGRTIYRFTE